MKRLQWDRDKEEANLSPEQKEILHLKEENSRLKGLLELREDRSALEKYQVDSRNRILGFAGAIIFAITVVFFSALVLLQSQSAQKDEQLKERNDIIKKLKKGVMYIPPGAGDASQQ